MRTLRVEGGIVKKIDRIINGFDERVEQAVLPVWKRISRYFVLFSSTLLFLLVGIFCFKVFHSRPAVLTSVIREDLAQIERALREIDRTCNILSIRPDHAVIDFLTVQRFSGSAVGALNLAYPKKWQGPYLKRNPSFQEHLYQIVQTKDGNFVLPGQGVQLPNGLVIGKDIVLGKDSPVNEMLKAGGRLNYQSEALGIRLSFKVGDWDTPAPERGTVDQINDMIKEFNEAMPFAQRAQPLATISC